MTSTDYKKQVKKQFRLLNLKSDVKKEILGDLEEFLENEPQENDDLVQRLGTPSVFVSSYLTEEELNAKPNVFLRLLQYAILGFLGLICLILASAPLVWLVAVIFQLPVEVGYIFQFFVSLIMFGLGYAGLSFIRKKIWL